MLQGKTDLGDGELSHTLGVAPPVLGDDRVHGGEVDAGSRNQQAYLAGAVDRDDRSAGALDARAISRTPPAFGFLLE